MPQDDMPTSNQLGPYVAEVGYYFAVQIQGNLYGDTNASDWDVFQGGGVTGTVRDVQGGPARKINYPAPDDSPFAFAQYLGKGRLDWLDAPGIGFAYAENVTFS
jgi:hypothetical protein